MAKKRKNKLKITRKEIESVIFILAFAVAINVTTAPIDAIFGGINIWVRAIIGIVILGVLAFLFNIRR